MQPTAAPVVVISVDHSVPSSPPPKALVRRLSSPPTLSPVEWSERQNRAEASRKRRVAQRMGLVQARLVAAAERRAACLQAKCSALELKQLHTEQVLLARAQHSKELLAAKALYASAAREKRAQQDKEREQRAAAAEKRHADAADKRIELLALRASALPRKASSSYEPFLQDGGSYDDDEQDTERQTATKRLLARGAIFALGAGMLLAASAASRAAPQLEPETLPVVHEAAAGGAIVDEVARLLAWLGSLTAADTIAPLTALGGSILPAAVFAVRAKVWRVWQ